VPYAAVNRLNMYYEVHGDGPPLLLLHGGRGSIPERWIPFFADRFQVIAIEQMGTATAGSSASTWRSTIPRA
jgi:pimeloyl-ACP methyl ester carboxylesterase